MVKSGGWVQHCHRQMKGTLQSAGSSRCSVSHAVRLWQRRLFSFIILSAPCWVLTSSVSLMFSGQTPRRFNFNELMEISSPAEVSSQKTFTPFLSKLIIKQWGNLPGTNKAIFRGCLVIVHVLTLIWFKICHHDATLGHWTLCCKLTRKWWPQWGDQTEWVLPAQDVCHRNWIRATWWHYSSGCTIMGRCRHWVIKKGRHQAWRQRDYELFLSPLKLHKYAIWKEQEP